MAAKKTKRASQADEEPQNNWYIVTLLTASCLLFANQIYPEPELHVQVRGVWTSFGKPKPLLNYQQFRMLYPLEPRTNLAESSNRKLCFNLDLIEIAQTNLATLSRKQTYFIQQTPVRSDRTLDEQSQLSHILSQGLKLEGIDGSSLEGESPVAAADVSEKLETKDPLLRYFQRIRGNDFDEFEIPNLPLEGQTDPERITHIDADLRHPCSSEIRNQKSCGACYAFSWMAMVEWHYCKQTGEPVDFSEQYMIDCSKRANLGGCTAGFLKDAKDFTLFFGLFTEKQYPYKGKEKKCLVDYGSMKAHIKQWSRLKVDREQWEKTLEEQPIIVQVNAPSDINSYSRGIHPGHNCNEKINHGMLLVGHGRQNGVPYWLFKNSQGKKWGENGFMRIDRRAPMKECFPNAFITKIKFAHLDNDKYDDLYDTIKFEPLIHEFTTAERLEMERKRAELEAKRGSFGGKVMSFVTGGGGDKRD